MNSAKKAATSTAIISRYWRCEITPSIGVIKKLAYAFGVTLDSLEGNHEISNLLHDQPYLRVGKNGML